MQLQHLSAAAGEVETASSAVNHLLEKPPLSFGMCSQLGIVSACGPAASDCAPATEQLQRLV